MARRLPDMALVSAAFARGELSYSKVRALSRVVTPANEADLVSLAANATAAQLDRLVRAYRQATPDDTDKANARHARRRRYLRYYWDDDDDGSLAISGRLSPEDGVVVVAALRAAGLVADKRRRGKGDASNEAAPGDQATPDPAEQPDGDQADAGDPAAPQGDPTDAWPPPVGDEFIGDSPAGERGDQPPETPAEDCDHRQAETPAGVVDVYSAGPVELARCPDREEEPDDPWVAAQADALVGLAESFLVTGPASSSHRAQAIVHVDLDALTNDGQGCASWKTARP